MAPSTPHVVGCCPTLSRIGYWPLAQVGRVFHGHCSTPVSKSPRQLGCTQHTCVHTPCPARSRCSSCRRRRPRQHCTITRGTRQILHGSHGTPAAVPCACVGSAARARARSIARRLRQHAARGRAHQRAHACACTWLGDRVGGFGLAAHCRLPLVFSAVPSMTMHDPSTAWRAWKSRMSALAASPPQTALRSRLRCSSRHPRLPPLHRPSRR